MTPTRWLVVLFAPAAMMATLVVAAEPAPEKPWSDEAELSYVETGGNSEVKTLSVKNLLKGKLTEALTGSWKIAALRGETAGVLTAERYLMELRLDYPFTPQLYGFGTLGWSKDEFAGIESSAYIGPGIGYKFLTGPRHVLAAETGFQYTNEQYTNATESERIDGRLFGSYTFAFSEKNKFVQTLEYLHDFDDSDNYRINTETALVTTLTSLFSFKVSYTIRYDHQPVPSTLDTTDTTLSAALLATF